MLEQIKIETVQELVLSKPYTPRRLILKREGNTVYSYYSDKQGTVRPVLVDPTFIEIPSTPSVPGGSVGYEEMKLSVVVQGQTQFNIFQMPASGQKTELVVSHLIFLEGDGYIFGTNGPNVVLIWTDDTELVPGDVLVFRKYKL